MHCVTGIKFMAKIIIDEARCKGCGLCTVVCPSKLNEMGNKLNLQGYPVVTFVDDDGRCTACSLCAKTCPDVAISVFKKKGA